MAQFKPTDNTLRITSLTFDNNLQSEGSVISKSDNKFMSNISFENP